MKNEIDEQGRSDQEHVEEAVIGGVLILEENFPTEVLRVEPEHFESKKRALIWSTIRAMIDMGEPIDEITLSARCKKDHDENLFVYLNKLADETPTAVNLDWWADALKQHGAKRVLDKKISDIIALGDEPSSVAVQINQLVKDDASGSAGGLVPVTEPVMQLKRELEIEKENPESIVVAKTGIPKIDLEVQMKPGELTVIGGRPGMGKSAFAGSIVANCAQNKSNKPVALFSLEMSAVSIIRRMVAAEARVSTRNMAQRLGDGNLTNAIAKVYDFNLLIDTSPMLDVGKMRQNLLRTNGVSLVVVDYIQLMKMDKSLERHDLRVGGITRDLKNLSMEFGCHVIALSQLNRNVEGDSRRQDGHRPRTSDLRDSGSIEQDADKIMLLYRPSVVGIGEPDSDDAEIILSKHRDGGRPMVFKLRWDSTTLEFVDGPNL